MLDIAYATYVVEPVHWEPVHHASQHNTEIASSKWSCSKSKVAKYSKFESPNSAYTE